MKFDGNENVTGPAVEHVPYLGTVSRLIIHVSQLVFMQPYDTDFSVSLISLFLNSFFHCCKMLRPSYHLFVKEWALSSGKYVQEYDQSNLNFNNYQKNFIEPLRI